MNATFTPSVLGITAFSEPNRIDFVLDGPEIETPHRASVFFNNPNAEVKLANRKLKILPPDLNDDGELLYPGRLSIRWGRRTINLGMRRNAEGQTSWYRSIDTSNDSARPKTGEALYRALGYEV